MDEQDTRALRRSGLVELKIAKMPLRCGLFCFDISIGLIRENIVEYTLGQVGVRLQVCMTLRWSLWDTSFFFESPLIPVNKTRRELNRARNSEAINIVVITILVRRTALVVLLLCFA